MVGLIFGAFRAAELGARLGMDAVRMSQRAGPRGLPPPKTGKTAEVTNGTVAGVVIAAFTLPFAIAIFTSGYDGHVSGMAVVRFLVACWGLMAVWGIGSAIAKKLYTRSVLHNYAKPSPDTETADMRAYLTQLLAAEPAATGHRELPAAKNPVTFCHIARMRDAVSSGAAVADDIVPMFGNNVPRGLLP